MKLQSFEAVVGALNDAGVRYLIAGGLAVNAHGYLRFTHDVDLIALQGEVLPGLPTRFVSIATLIDMKRVADRPRDRDDIQHLQWILEESEQQDG